MTSEEDDLSTSSGADEDEEDVHNTAHSESKTCDVHGAPVTLRDGDDSTRTAPEHEAASSYASQSRSFKFIVKNVRLP